MNSIIEAIKIRSQTNANEVAWRFEREGKLVNISWSQYYQQISFVAKNLQKNGLGLGKVAAICASNSIEWEIIEKAFLHLGIAVVGVDIRLPSKDKEYLLELAKTNVLVVSSQADLQNYNAKILEQLEKIIFIKGEGDNNKILSFVDLNKEDPTLPTADLPLPELSWPAVIALSSGTSSNPSAILYNHQQYFIGALAMAENLLGGAIVKNRIINICWFPLSQLYQRLVNSVMIIWNAQSQIIDETQNIFAEIIKIQPTIFFGVPKIYEKLYEDFVNFYQNSSALKKKFLDFVLQKGELIANFRQQNQPLPLHLKFLNIFLKFSLSKIAAKLLGKNIRFLFVGGAPSSLKAQHFFKSLNIPIFCCYGMAESVVLIAANSPGDYKEGSVGKILPQNQVVISEDGEILLKGSGVCDGYLNSNGKNYSLENGFMKTGDLGYFDEDGFLFLEGRKSDVIKTSQIANIYPKKIENLLTKNDFIRYGVVVGNNRELPAVIIDPANIGDVSKDQLIDKTTQVITEINKNLAEYEQIAVVLIVGKGFSVEDGQITLGLKIRRQFIEKKYQEQLDVLYKKITNQKQKPIQPIVEVLV
jgi:long-chain acyl-CoA synthetase